MSIDEDDGVSMTSSSLTRKTSDRTSRAVSMDLDMDEPVEEDEGEESFLNNHDHSIRSSRMTSRNPSKTHSRASSINSRISTRSNRSNNAALTHHASTSDDSNKNKRKRNSIVSPNTAKKIKTLTGSTTTTTIKTTPRKRRIAESPSPTPTPTPSSAVSATGSMSSMDEEGNGGSLSPPSVAPISVSLSLIPPSDEAIVSSQIKKTLTPQMAKKRKIAETPPGYEYPEEERDEDEEREEDDDGYTSGTSEIPLIIRALQEAKRAEEVRKEAGGDAKMDEAERRMKALRETYGDSSPPLVDGDEEEDEEDEEEGYTNLHTREPSILESEVHDDDATDIGIDQRLDTKPNVMVNTPSIQRPHFSVRKSSFLRIENDLDAGEESKSEADREETLEDEGGKLPKSGLPRDATGRISAAKKKRGRPPKKKGLDGNLISNSASKASSVEPEYRAKPTSAGKQSQKSKSKLSPAEEAKRERCVCVSCKYRK